ncbi:olfactory receptor 14J1-like [Caloenas nicobarica]|uniref:olfactory receptor 14J1-like n=1 Tax=Caloenas nicobarica TaxID=187106 RepID=UPI0032B79270
MSNGSSITQFHLLPFADTRELQLLHFWLFLGIYLAALLGNGLVITTYTGCVAQLFLFVFSISTEYFLLTVMAYDRHVAICKPLHYGTLLGSRACVHMAAAAWATGFLNALLQTANTFSLPLCKGNVLDQFFCEIPRILKLSCSDTYLREAGLIVFSACLISVCFIFIVLSYVQIFRAVLRIPSEQGRHKAFSTCLPHLAVVSLFVSTVIFAHLKPPSISSPSLDLVVSVLYSLVPPGLETVRVRKIFMCPSQELKKCKELMEKEVSNEEGTSLPSGIGRVSRSSWAEFFMRHCCGHCWGETGTESSCSSARWVQP